MATTDHTTRYALTRSRYGNRVHRSSSGTWSACGVRVVTTLAEADTLQELITDKLPSYPPETYCSKCFAQLATPEQTRPVEDLQLPEPAPVPAAGLSVVATADRALDALEQAAAAIEQAQADASVDVELPAREPRVTDIPGIGRFIDGRAVCSAPGCDVKLPPPAATGRPRRTCSAACRVRLHRAERAARPAPARPWVVVACGGDKRDRPCPAGEMYVGSYHRAARRAAQALTSPDRILILSGFYGLLPLDQLIEPYDLRIDSPDGVGPRVIARQMRDRGLAEPGQVIVLGGKAYGKAMRSAVRELTSPTAPHLEPVRAGTVALSLPLEGTSGIGEQLQLMAAMARTGESNPAELRRALAGGTEVLDVDNDS